MIALAFSKVFLSGVTVSAEHSVFQIQSLSPRESFHITILLRVLLSGVVIRQQKVLKKVFKKDKKATSSKFS